MLRGISLLLALTTTFLVMVMPFLVSRHMNGAVHGAVTVLAVGTMACFVHGLGFTPHMRPLRLLASPWLAWTLTAVGAAWLVVA